MQPLDSISVPAKDTHPEMSKDTVDREARVKQIRVPMLAKMFLFGSYVKNQALKKIKKTNPEESNRQSLHLYFLLLQMYQNKYLYLGNSRIAASNSIDSNLGSISSCNIRSRLLAKLLPRKSEAVTPVLY